MQSFYETITAELDAVKYHNKTYTKQEMITLLEDLRKSSVQTDHCQQCDMQFDQGFAHAKSQVKYTILQNSDIKTRGEMIAALHELEMN